MEACPCGSEKAYSECCEPLISGSATAETAEALLRSRYSAYVRSETDYIADTIHPDQKDPDSRETIESWSKDTRWHKLEIIDVRDGGPEDEEGEIEFIADFTEKNKKQQHYEIAEFKKMEGKWYFYNARPPEIKQVVRSGPKIGRNDPCTCGSGKKYKKCCGK